MGAIALITPLCKSKSRKLRILVLSSFVIIIAIVYDYAFELLKYFNLYYSPYLVGLGREGGLASKIFALQLFPLGLILRILYGLVSPVPSALLNIVGIPFDVDSFGIAFQSIGTILQIMSIPFFVFSDWTEHKTEALVFWVLFLGIVVTTFTFRHFIFIYPFMVLLIISRVSQMSMNRYLVITFGEVSILAILGCIYMLWVF